MSEINGMRVKACVRCGAIVTLTTRGGNGIDNEPAHLDWHERQDELLTLLTQSAQAFSHLTGNGGN